MSAEAVKFETLPDGKLVFPSWESAISYIDVYVITDFKLVRREDGRAVVEIFPEGGSAK